ncbi:hypothetical protein, partial [Pseudomonas avellanae]|uniref:hypothetical protein n=1 Tax=Pseudomonas avellanae TaxID=46257 RepID=UPI001955474E
SGRSASDFETGGARAGVTGGGDPHCSQTGRSACFREQAPTSKHHPVGVTGAAIRIAHEGAGTANENLLNN